MSPATCSKGCGKELGSRNKSGLCRSCRARDILGTPEAMARAKAGINRYLADPGKRADRQAQSAANLARWRASPEGREKLLKNAHRQLEKARQADEPARRRAIRAAAHPGIPEHRWDEVVELTKTMPADEARRVVREDEAFREARRLAALTPFERMQEKLANGGRLVPAFNPKKAEPAFTLGGIASAAL